MVADTISFVVTLDSKSTGISRSLDSVRHQSYRPLRLIVVDAGVPGETMNEINRWIETHNQPDFAITLIQESSSRKTHALNSGLRAVDSEVVIFLDANDSPVTELAITVMEAFNKKKMPDIVFWRTALINDRQEVRPHRFSKVNIFRHHIYHDVLSLSSYAVRTSFIRKIGAWNSDLLRRPDYELGLRILAADPLMTGINRTLVYNYPDFDAPYGYDSAIPPKECEKTISAMERIARGIPGNIGRLTLLRLLYIRVMLAVSLDGQGEKQDAARLLQSALESDLLTRNRKVLLKILYKYALNGGKAGYLLWI